MATGVYRPPLAGVAVADLSGGPLAAVGRLLADLGADVTQVSWPGVSDTETVGPVVSPAGSAGGGVPLGTAIHRAGLARLTVGTGSGEDGGPAWAAVLARLGHPDREHPARLGRRGAAGRARHPPAAPAAGDRERSATSAVGTGSAAGRGRGRCSTR